MGFEKYPKDKPLDASAPSRNFIGMPTATDVFDGSIYDMLLSGLRVLDIEQGDELLRRFLARPQEQMTAFQQKVWLLASLVDYRRVPADLLKLLRAHVGFGPGTGLPGRIADRLDATGLRKLIKLAVPYWTRRGRLDALSDSLRTLATGIRPAIDDWFCVRFLLDEVLMGVDGLPGVDPWLLYGSVLNVPAGGGADGDVQVSLRVPDLGSLDRQLVQDIAELARPANERYELAYVSFVDTFIDGRLGHWVTRAQPAGQWSPATPASTPPILPGLKLTAPGREKVDVPQAATWTNYTVACVVDMVAGASLRVRFYASGDNDYYYVDLLQGTDSVKFGRFVGGVQTPILSVVTDLSVPAARGLRVEVVHHGNDPNQVRVYVDGALVLQHFGDSTFRQGWVEFESTFSAYVLHRPEMHPHPMTVVTLM